MRHGFEPAGQQHLQGVTASHVGAARVPGLVAPVAHGVTVRAGRSRNTGSAGTARSVTWMRGFLRRVSHGRSGPRCYTPGSSHLAAPAAGCSRDVPGTAASRCGRREAWSLAPVCGRRPYEDTNLQPTTRRWRAVVVAAVLALFVASYPAPGVLAETSFAPSNDGPSATTTALDHAASGSGAGGATIANATLPRVIRGSAHPRLLWRELRDGFTIAGRASWYSGTQGYAGVAHVAMPGARYIRPGRTSPRARVCAGTRCVTVRVVDSCGCFARTSRARVADLSITVVRRLRLHTAAGVFRVRITLIRR
jgi:hypothetical protein